MKREKDLARMDTMGEGNTSRTASTDVAGSDRPTTPNQKRHEARVEKIMCHCVHFTGVQHSACEAGIAYADARGAGKLPCLREYADGATCDKAQFPTRDEAEAEYQAEETMYARHSLAHRAAHDDAKAKRFGKGQGGADSLPCPVCKTGRLYYRVAAYNGHMHAKCETDGCVQWME